MNNIENNTIEELPENENQNILDETRLSRRDFLERGTKLLAGAGLYSVGMRGYQDASSDIGSSVNKDLGIGNPDLKSDADTFQNANTEGEAYQDHVLTIPGKFQIFSNNELAYKTFFNHLGFSGISIFNTNVDNPRVKETDITNQIRAAESIQDLLKIRGLVNYPSMFIQIASRIEPDKLLTLIKGMVNGLDIPIIAPDTLYLDRASGRWRDPRDYIGLEVSVLPESLYDPYDGTLITDSEELHNHVFTAWVFDVKSPKDRDNSYHYGDASPSFYRKVGVHIAYPQKPYYQTPLVNKFYGTEISRKGLSWSAVPSVKYAFDKNRVGEIKWNAGEAFA